MLNNTSKLTAVLTAIKVPDGHEKAIIDIEKYIVQHGGNFNSKKLTKEILNFITIDSAIHDWVASIEHPETKRKYRRTMQKLLYDHDKLITLHPSYSIVCLDQHHYSGAYKDLLNQLDNTGEVKRFYATVYARFCDYVRTKTYGIVDPEVGLREQESFCKAEEIYGKVDWMAFLDTVDMPYRLIAKLIYNCAKQGKFRLRVSDRYKNMLSLRRDQINFERNTIHFSAEQSYHVTGCIMSVSNELAKDLKAYLGKEKEGLAFLSSTGIPLLPNQIERALAKASKKFNITPKITPTLLAWVGTLSFEKDVQAHLRELLENNVTTDKKSLDGKIAVQYKGCR